MKKKIVRLSVSLPMEDYLRVKNHASMWDLSLAQVVRKAIKDFVDYWTKKKGAK